jgi:hypothetical protein
MDPEVPVPPHAKGIDRMRAPLLVLAFSMLSSVPAFAEPRIEPSAPGSNFYIALEPMFLQTQSRTGGRVTLTLNDSGTPEVDQSLLGADGIDDEAYAPRILLGWKWNHALGVSGGVQARAFDLRDDTFGPPTLAPGTTELPNFATESETNSLELYTGDLEGTLSYSRWGATVEGTYGRRAAHFRTSGEIETFGVFTTGNFVQIQFSNGSAFKGHGNVAGLAIAYRVPKYPVSVFIGRRTSRLEGESDSFGRSVGTVASSPSPPLVGAATVTRNDEDETELEIGETRYGLQADFGGDGSRFRPFARVTYEKMKWSLDGPPTGGAGFGGTIGTLTTNGFASAGLGGAEVKGWSLALGMAF